MPHAELTLEVPDGVWIGDLTRSHPSLRIRVAGVADDAGSGFVLAVISGIDSDRAIEKLRELPEILEVDVMHHGGIDVLVYFVTETPLLLLPAMRSGVPVRLPITIRDGEVTWRLVISRARLNRLADALDEWGMSYRVEAIRQGGDGRRLLTPMEREVIHAAVDAGFYDTPRRCTLTELAERLGTPKSTCCERIQRAEGKIIGRFVAQPERRFGIDATR